MKAVSSAYVAKREPGSLGYGRSAVKMVYKTGPCTLPWDTPAQMHLLDDLLPLTSTNKFRSKRHRFRRRYCAVGGKVFSLNSRP